MLEQRATLTPMAMKPCHLPPGTTRGRFTPNGLPTHHFGASSSRFADLFAAPGSISTAYDPRIAYLLSIVSGWSYSDGQTLADKLQYYGFPNNSVREISVVNEAMLVVATSFFIQSSDGRVGILVFRGTEPGNIMNWLTDAATNWKDFAHGRVHSGFFNNVEAIWDDVEHALSEACATTAKGRRQMETLYLGGHSLGGAMAILAAARMFAAGEASAWCRALKGIYTFGQPMVGDKSFAESSNLRFGHLLHRHVFHQDAVPSLPPKTVEAFAHFGQLRVAESTDESWRTADAHLPAQATSATLTSASCAASFVSRRLRWFKKLPLPYSLDDHSPTGYIDLSRRALAVK
jgi:hypothetical protein